MKHRYPLHNLHLPKARSWLVWLVFILPVASLVWACNLGHSSDLEQQQAANMQLAKALHKHVNHHDWQAAGNLCAETIRYRGRATQFTDIDEPKARFLTHYQNTRSGLRLISMEIRQLYPAGKYHVIVEGVARGDPPDTTLPVCLIYTIENEHITRLYAY